MLAQERAVVLDRPLQRLPGQIQPVEGGVAALQQRQHAEGLVVVAEAAEIGHGGVERILPAWPKGV